VSHVGLQSLEAQNCRMRSYPRHPDSNLGCEEALYSGIVASARRHHIAMPDDLHPLMPRRNPEDFDLGAIKTDLEFIIERLSKLPTRQFALRPLYVIAGSAGLVIAWIELFRRVCL
jgi:hypothetical protein